jgi:hypothetical protein
MMNYFEYSQICRSNRCAGTTFAAAERGVCSRCFVPGVIVIVVQSDTAPADQEASVASLSVFYDGGLASEPTSYEQVSDLA